MQTHYSQSVSYQPSEQASTCCPHFEQLSTCSDDSFERCPTSRLAEQNTPQSSAAKPCAAKPKVDLTKQKSELCRTFLEKGYCPYNQKCKFAHGSHELRQNQEFNSRYKTKECGSYFKRGFCCYGDRCNFVHRSNEGKDTRRQQAWALIMKNYRQTVMETRVESTLLRVLGKVAEN